MKKKVLFSAVTLLTAFGAKAQLPASTTPQNKKVLLEEFTGIHCVYCPDGHKRANELKAAKPDGAVQIVNIHTGGYAQPAAGEPDFRTAEGAAIAAISGMNITGYPTGSVNRRLFGGQAGFATNRGVWGALADSVLAMPSYVNVAVEGTLDVTTRVLTVNAQAYFTANSTATADNLTVMLTEDLVRGPQTGGANFYPAMINADGSYTHNHMLRKVLTSSAMGEAISPTTAGTTINKTYTFTVPAQFVNNAPQLGNLHLIAFVAQGNSNVMTTADGPITLTGFQYTKDMQAVSVTTDAGVCAGKFTPTVSVYNNGSDPITSATLSYSANGGTASTYTFSGNIAPATSGTITLPAISFTPATTNTVTVNVTAVNGSADGNSANNTATSVSAPLTTIAANYSNMTMDFVQDQYGSESSWKLFNESTGAVVAQDGPFTDLSAAGTVTHIKSFTVDPSTCYKLEVYDSYGDGINSGTGVGGYKLVSGNTVIINSNGKYGKQDNKWYKAAATLTTVPYTSVNNIGNSLVDASVFPNPATESANVRFSLSEKMNVDVQVYDATGRLVATPAQGNMNKGIQTVNINTQVLATGIYSVKINTEKGALTLRLSVVK